MTTLGTVYVVGPHKDKNTSAHKHSFPCLTRHVDVDGGEGGERHGGDVLHSHSEREEASRLVVQVLGHQDGRRAVRPVRFDVEPNRHVGLRHLTLLEVVGHTGVTEWGRRLDGLTETERGGQG